jgi:hypothetical protein
VAKDNGGAPLPRRVPGAKRRPGDGPLARPVLSASDLERIRAALDSAEDGASAQVDAAPAVLPAPPASGPGGVTDEISTPPAIAAQPGTARAAQPEAASAVPADAKPVPAQPPPAGHRPDHRDEETAIPEGKQAASPVQTRRENGQASPEQPSAHWGNGQASRGKSWPRSVKSPPGPPRPAPPKAAAPSPKPSRPRGRGRPSRVITGGAILTLVLLSAGSAFLLTRHAGTVEARTSAATGVAIRNRAAAWVASQVSRSGLVSCDQVMCQALEARGIPAADLLVLRRSGPDPLRSSVIVVTAAVTRLMGSGLLTKDAPATLASFGSGNKRISIRMIFAQGAAAYASVLRRGLAARKANESGLLNPRITMSPVAHRQLAVGQVDARLVMTIANMAAVWPIYIITFGDPAPGASPGIPLRCAELAVTGSRAGAHLADQARLMSVFVHGLDEFYVGARIHAVRLAGGRAAVQIGFTAPSPLGWLSTATP